MTENLIIEEIKEIEQYKEALSQLLVKVVDGGAAVGFLPPLQMSKARDYWDSVVNPDVILLIAKVNNVIVGTVQLHMCTKTNGLHRAEIAKVMTDPDYRRRGISRFLLREIEERAVLENRSLLILDTREGDPSNQLYTSIGFVKAGRIPHFAKSANGELHATVIYFKELKTLQS